jgi:hypothetical protein
MASGVQASNSSVSGACKSIEYCGWLETRNSAPTISTAAWICSTVHSLKPEVARLAGGHDLPERFEDLLDRDVGVEAVRLVEVDVVGAQALKRRVDLLAERGSRSATRRGRDAQRAHSARVVMAASRRSAASVEDV